MDIVGLADKRTTRVKALSGGQRRRLDLALGLVGAPELLFLDEPTTGFDPSARRQAWSLVSRLRDLGTTVLLTTHYMDEAQHLADRAAVVSHGRLVALGRPEELGVGLGLRPVLEFRLPDGVTAGDVPVLGGDVAVADHDVTVSTPCPLQDVHTLSGWALERGLDLSGLTLTPPSLEDVYLQLTGATGEQG